MGLSRKSSPVPSTKPTSGGTLRNYKLMKHILKLVPIFVFFGLLLAACRGNETSSLAVANQITLVFIYTDG